MAFLVFEWLTTPGADDMSVYWNLVNPGKRQYLDPAHLRWRRKMGGVVNGPPALALGLLVCASHRWHEDLAGSWHGDAVYFANDSDSEPPNSWGIVTVAPHDLERQLYTMAHEEFTDISHQAVAMIKNYSGGITREWAGGATSSDLDLFRTVPAPGSSPRVQPSSGGQCLLVNPGKRQYLRPGCMLWPDAMSDVLGGAATLALSALVCRAHWWRTPNLAGSWHGDAVYFANESDPADGWRIVTATHENPARNLYAMACQEFTDISQRALAVLADHVEGIADEWAAHAVVDELYLVDLGYAALVTRAEPLTAALERQFGRGWTKRFEKAFEAHPDRVR